jgi:hypothetical protein
MLRPSHAHPWATAQQPGAMEQWSNGAMEQRINGAKEQRRKVQNKKVSG